MLSVRLGGRSLYSMHCGFGSVCRSLAITDLKNVPKLVDMFLGSDINSPSTSSELVWVDFALVEIAVLRVFQSFLESLLFSSIILE